MQNLEIKKSLLVINNELISFESELKNIINCKKNFLTEKLNSFLFINPKRLRPSFIFLFSKILGIDSALVQKIALIAELIHNASLIHDDVIDEDCTRREQKTFHVEFDTKLAILEGDFLLSLALVEMSKTNLDIIKIFSNKILRTIQGEILQNENIDKIVDFETYYNKTFEKTGNLFMAGLEALFSLDEVKKDVKNNLLNFMENFSIAFQIKNDIDNISGNCSDIKNGNYTLPMLYFNMDNETKFCEKYVLKSREKINEYRLLALKFLDNLDNSQYKDSLFNLVNVILGE